MYRVQSIGGERGHWRDGTFFSREWTEIEELTPKQLADPRIMREEINSEPAEVREELPEESTSEPDQVIAVDFADDSPVAIIQKVKRGRKGGKHHG